MNRDDVNGSTLLTWQALRWFDDASRFSHIEGEIIIDPARIPVSLKKRALQAVKRGYGTTIQGPTEKLLEFTARVTGYGYGFSYQTWHSISLYAPGHIPVAEFIAVADGIEALLELQGVDGNAYKRRLREDSYRNKEERHAVIQGRPSPAQQKQLRAFLKDQMLRWAIHRQPMIDFLESGAPKVWTFSSTKDEEARR